MTSTQTSDSLPPLLDRFVNGMERLAGWVMRHWVGVLNALFLLYVGLPFLAPVLMHVGAEGPARLIYLIYRPACHQLPERSYFLFGSAPVYDLADLPQQGVADALALVFAFSAAHGCRWSHAVGRIAQQQLVFAHDYRRAIWCGHDLAGLSLSGAKYRRWRKRAGTNLRRPEFAAKSNFAYNKLLFVIQPSSPAGCLTRPVFVCISVAWRNRPWLPINQPLNDIVRV